MNFQEVMALAKRRGILQPAYEPYGGVAGFLDYGPVGVRLRRKITELCESTSCWDSVHLKSIARSSALNPCSRHLGTSPSSTTC